MNCKRLLLMLLVALMAPWAAMAQQALPYSYGFENNDLSAEGWSTQNPSGLDASEFGISADAKKTGDYGFRFSSYNDRGDHTQYLISPELNATTGVIAQFYYRASSGSGTEKFKVGYSTTNTDIASFNFGSEISTSSTSWTQSAEFTFPAGTKYVAIYYYSNYQYRLFVDDLTFEAPASCPKPTGLVVSNITHNEAKLSWTENGTATSWQVCLNNDETDLITANSNPYTLTGLTPTTAYTAKVRAIGNDEYSAWSNEVSFSTTAEAEAVGDSWSDDFEGTSCGWELVNGTLTNAWAWGTATNNGGTHALYVSNDGGTSNAYTVNSAAMVYATKLLNFAEGKYEFAYDWNANGESTYDYLRVALVPASVTLTAGTSYPTGFGTTTLPTGWIAVDGGSKLNLATAWQSKSVAINVTAGNYYLVIAWRDDTSGGTQPPAAVDNVSITRMACPYDVTGLAVNDVTTNSAGITWTAGEATGWQVAYKTNEASEWTENEPVSTNSTTLRGLAASTNYQVKVRAYCGGQDYGSWCEPITFATECEAISTYPWTENFDSYTGATSGSTNNLPLCWNYINTSTYSYYKGYPVIYSGSSYSNSGNNHLRFYSNYSSYSNYDPQDQYAILPEMSSLAGKEVVLYARGYNTSSTFKIGTMSDPDDASTFVPITEQALTTSYQKFSYIIPAGCTDSHLAIMIDAATSSRTTNGVYIDDITVKEMVTVDADEIVAANPGEGQMTWSRFAEHVNNGDHFTNPTITLMENITITEMVGTAENPFTGTFDGNGKTITANITSGETAVAPFHYIKDATIKNLTMTGTVTETATTSDGYHAGGLVGYAWSGYNIIENCRVSTDVTIAGYGGGIVGHGKTSVVFLKGCVYDGTITNALNVDGNNKGVGGLVGWFDGGAALNIHDSYYDGTYTENEGVSVYFHPVACKTGGASVTVNIYDCYYTCDNPAADSDGTNNVVTNAGQKAYKVTGAEDITVDLPSATIHYSCSGISGDDNATWNGIKIGDDIYGGEGVTLTLALEGANGYEADHGTLTPISTTYTLLMEAYNTVISGVDCPVPYNVYVDAPSLTAHSARVFWNGGSDSYTVQYREVITAPVDMNTTYDFEDGTLQGWTSYDEDGDGNGWTTGSSSSTAHGGSGYVYARYNSNAVPNDWLISPEIPLGGTFSFYAKKSSGTEQFQVYISTTGNNISNFTAISEVIDAGATYNFYEYDLSSYSGNGYVAIKHTGAVDQYWFYVDDITITTHAEGEYGAWQTLSNAESPQTIDNLTPETTYQVKVSGTCDGVETDYSDVVEFTTPASCLAPTELAVTENSVTAHEATITWTENGEATTWIVEYAGNADFTDALTETVEDDATYSFDNLDGETTYYVRVKAHCGDEDESYYSNVVNFTTLVACPVPTVLTVTAPTTTTATLSWTENGTATAWQICLNGDETNLIDADSNPFVLDEGLTAATSYTVKVRANCGGIDGESAWSNEVSFTTLCEAITTFPWSEDFESYSASSSGVKFEVPCWVNEHISGNGSYFFEVYSGTNGTNSTKQLRLRDMSNGTMTKLMLPEMTLPGTDYLFSIDVYRNVSTANYGEGIRVFVSTDGEIEGATELAFISRSYATSDGNLIPAESVSGWYTYELPIGISGTCYIILRGESLYGSSTYMDNFAVKQMPSCLKPTALECTVTTTTTATFSWTNGAADQTAWQICLNGDEENLIMANSHPFTVEGLTASTAYTAKVRAYCSEEDQSDWSNEVSFTTECDVITVDLTHPFTEGFEGTTFAPLCWESIASGTHAWSRSTSYHHGDGSASAYSGYYGDIYLIMPDIQISSEVGGAQLSFWSYNSYVSDYDKNSVVLINGENETELWSPESVSQSWVSTTIDLTAYMGQTISLAFKYEGNNAHGWFIDDVKVEVLFTKTIEAVGETEWANGKGGYYLIASPVVENVTPAANNGFIAETAANYDLYYFNQAAPVDTETGIRLEWINFKETAANGGNFSIENGKGYLYASKEGTTLSFTGTPYSGDGQVTLSKTDGADWAGWNLVGNPFAQDAYITKPFYTLENSDTYTPNEAGTAIQAMQGLLVVADSDKETVTFTTTAPVAKNSKLNMNLRRNNKQLDNAILVFGGEQQLGKMTFRANSSKIYMPVEGKDYAITSVEGQVGEVPVSFVPESNGTYSLSFTSEEVSFSYLHLIDNITGNDVNLLQTPSYTFDARTTDYESRFKLVFAVGSSANDETFGFVNASGNFCIFGIEGEATVQVIDVLGHMLSSETFSGSYERKINGAPGVYMVRLIQGNDIRVQKMVVR